MQKRATAGTWFFDKPAKKSLGINSVRKSGPLPSRCGTGKEDGVLINSKNIA
jgi:hypothetical protein